MDNLYIMFRRFYWHCCFGANLTMNILFHYPELPNGCAAYGCVLHFNTQVVYTYARALGGILGISVGILFLVITLWMKKTQPEIGNKVRTIIEAVVFRVVIFGTFCDFIPHFVDAIFISITEINPLSYIGPYSRFIMATDLLLNSTMNWLVFKKMNRKVTVVKFNAITTTRNL